METALNISRLLCDGSHNPSFEDKQLTDILCFLMSNMTKEVMKKFLMEDLRKHLYSQVLWNLIRGDKG